MGPGVIARDLRAQIRQAECFGIAEATRFQRPVRRFDDTGWRTAPRFAYFKV